MPNPPLDALTKINLDDLVNAFGVKKQPALEGAVRFLFRGAARKFARQMLEFDAAIGEQGLSGAARQTERLLARDVRVYGAERLPASAFLALSNHPGMTDTLALFCALPAPDLKIIALHRPFLLSLPNLSRKLFYVTDNASERISLVRQASAHLRSGRSLLTFPAGHNEPDPDVYPGAVESLATWTDSVEIFLRLAPQAAIVPIVVRGVLWEAAARNPLVRLKRTRDERELLSVALQLSTQVLLNLRPVRVRIQIGCPITSKDVGAAHPQALHHAVLTEMKRLLENPPRDAGISLL